MCLAPQGKCYEKTNQVQAMPASAIFLPFYYT